MIPIVVQARIESHRMHGKVLSLIMWQPMLLWQLDRLSRVRHVHQVIVAVPDTPDSHTLADTVSRHGYTCCTPHLSPDDVLGRYAAVMELCSNADALVRVTGDCPLVDPAVVDAALDIYNQEDVDYVALDRMWPDGLDVEVISRFALLEADKEATDPADREHVTPYIWRNPERFRSRTLPCPFNLESQCWSVDTPKDWRLVSYIFTGLIERIGHGFGWRDVMTLIARDVDLRVWATSRKKNQAYMEQVYGANAPSWQSVRYPAEPIPPCAGLEGAI